MLDVIRIGYRVNGEVGWILRDGLIFLTHGNGDLPISHQDESFSQSDNLLAMFSIEADNKDIIQRRVNLLVQPVVLLACSFKSKWSGQLTLYH